MVGRRRKTFRLHLLKRTKTVPKKRNLDQKINDSKLHIWSNLKKKDHSCYNTVSLKKASFILRTLTHSTL